MFANLTIPQIPNKNAFNFIRLICCLIVIYEHTLGITGVNYPKLGLAEIAVDVFFILSGFWVTFSLLRSKNLGEYFKKRAKKILPLYYGVVIFFAVFLAAFSNIPARGYFTDAGFYKYLFVNGIFLNFLYPSLPGVFGGAPVNGSLWTIKLEIGFYLLLPLILFAGSKLQSKRDITGTENSRRSAQARSDGVGYNVILCIVYALSVIYNLAAPRICEAKDLPLELAHQLPAFMSYFACGMLFLNNWDFFRRHELKFFVPCLAYIICSCAFRKSFMEALTPFALCQVVMFLAVRLSFFNPIGAKNDYSYPMYLIHYPVIRIMRELDFFARKPFVACACVFAIAFTAAYLVNEIKRLIKQNISQNS